MRFRRFNLYEADDDAEIDDFDIVDDFINDSEFLDTDNADYDTILESLNTISSKLSISGRLDRNDDNIYIFSISSSVKVMVEFYDSIQSVETEIVNKKKAGNDYSVMIDCSDDTTEIANMSDYLNTAILLIKEIQDKLM